MRMRLLGRTGLLVSELCFGAMTFGENQWGVGGLQQSDADRMVGRCLEAGINFFDTADVYANGQSEVILGKALGGHRQEVVLATKVRGRLGAGPNDVGLSRRHILASVDGSLKRLGTDYIDLYQVHGWDARTQIDETMRALDDVVRSGKVRYIGMSNFAAWQLARALWLSDRDKLARFESAQMYYSLLGRDVEDEVVPLLVDQSVSMLVWSPLAGGFLSGKYHRDAGSPGGARLKNPGQSFPPIDAELGYLVVDKLRELSGTMGGSPAQLSIAWLLAQPSVTSVIVGARRQEQLEDNLKAADLAMPQDALRELSDLTRPASRYPGWMIRNQNAER